MQHSIFISRGQDFRLEYVDGKNIIVKSPRVPQNQACQFYLCLKNSEAITTFIRASNLTYCDGLEPPDYWLMVLFILFFGRADCSRVSRNWLEDARGLTPVSNIHTFYAFAERLNNNHLTQEKAHQFFNALAEAYPKDSSGALKQGAVNPHDYIELISVLMPYCIPASRLPRPLLSGIFTLSCSVIFRAFLYDNRLTALVSLNDLKSAARSSAASFILSSVGLPLYALCRNWFISNQPSNQVPALSSRAP